MQSVVPPPELAPASAVAATRPPPRQEAPENSVPDWTAIIESVTDAFVVLNRDWRYTYLNRAAEALLGVPRARLVGEVLWQAMPMVVGTRFERQFRRAVRDKVTVEFESRRNEDAKWLAVKAYPTDDGGLAVLMRDVTERRRAVKALRDSEARLRLAIEAAGMGAFEHSFARGTIRWSAQAKRILGFDPAQRDPDVDQWLQRIHPEDRERVGQAVARLIDAGADAQIDYRVTLSPGETRWIHGWARALFDDKGKPVRAYGVFADVTARSEAEQALRQSEERFRDMAEITPGILFTTDARGVCDYINRRFYDFTGIAPGASINASWAQALHPEDRQGSGSAWQRARDNGTECCNEFRFRAADGSYRWFVAHSRPIHDAQGHIVRWFGACTDIDELKRAQEALARSEEKFRTLSTAAPVGVFQCDANGQVRYVNPMLCRISGLDEPESVAFGWLDAMRSEKCGSEREHCAAGGHWEREFRLQKKDGTPVWVHARVAPVGDAQGKPAGFVGTVEDITERKLGEIALQESEARFRQLAENIQGVFFLADRALTRILYVSPAYESLFGATRDSLCRDPHSFLDRVVAEDRQLVAAAVAKHANGEPLDTEYRVRGRDGALRWVWARSIPWQSGVGQELTAVFVEDITERKSAEDRRLGREVQQRDTLVREVHHRIKNNLQGVAGLLRLSMNQYPELEPVLDAAVTQLQSVALVHGIQSRAPDSRLVLGEMIDAISRSMASHIHGRIVVDPPPQDMARVEFVESEAVPIALVLNELITNAAKHSEPGERAAPITIRVASADAGVRIWISNPGALPRGFDYSSGSGLRTGLELVKLLLPPAGAALHLETDATGVKAVLELSPPVLTAIRPPSRQGSEP